MGNLFSVRDKVVFITGGNRNIGAAVALGFAGDGAKVVVGNTDGEKAKDIRAALAELGGDHLWLQVDVSDKASVEAAFEAIVARYGRIDVLFNNAGVRVNQTGLEHGEAEWDWLFDINVKGTMLCAQAAANIMKQQGGGRIVNTSSISASRGQLMRTSYCASKAAVDGYTRAAAVEWAPYNISVNAVAWGGVNIEGMPYEEMPEGMQKAYAMTPTRKLLDKDGLYGPVAFFAMDASAHVTGQVLSVDGGWSVQGKPHT